MQDAVQDLEKYKRLTEFIMGTADNTNWYVIVTSVAFLMLIIGIVVAFAVKKSKPKVSVESRTKRREIEKPLITNFLP